MRYPFLTGLLGLVVTVVVFVLFVRIFFIDQRSFNIHRLFASDPEGFEIRGVDVSHYQDEIDWENVRNAHISAYPVRFAFMKATEGQDLIDPNFADNFYKARQNDVIRGAYHFFKPNTDACRQAAFFIKQVHLEPGDLPPVLDVEDNGKLPVAQFQKAVKTWLDMVEQHYGVTPIIYTGYKFKLRYLSDADFDRYPYWIAHYYVSELKYKGEWLFWQYTDCGSVDGINGEVDCNIFNGTMDDLRKVTVAADSTTLEHIQ